MDEQYLFTLPRLLFGVMEVQSKPNISDHVPEIEASRIRMLYEAIREGTITQYGLVIGMATLGLVQGISALWIVSLLLVGTTLRILVQWNIKQYFNHGEAFSAAYWEMRMVWFLFLEAFITTIGLMLLIDSDHFLFFYIVIALVVILAAVSSVILVSSIKNHYARVLALLLPVCVELLLNGEPLYWAISGIVFFVVIPSLFRAGRKFHESLLETLKLRYENAELLIISQTEREKAEEERRRAERANAEKSRFLAAASHDLRQPTHALELFSDALERELDKPRQVELLNSMKESTAAMNALLYSLLDISRLDAGVVEVNKTEFLLHDLLARLIQAIEPQAESKGIKIKFQSQPCGVASDEVLLESIVNNLLGNALKYTDKGYIEVRCETQAEKVYVSIKDTGMGISAEHQRQVYDEFYQANNPERDRSKGLGLGLSIVRRTCALLGHEMKLESTLGQGSTFTIILNAAHVDAKPQVAKPSLQQLTATVLIIDDERAILKGMEKMLTPWGCQVITAQSLADALEQLQSFDGVLDMVIADYRLGDHQKGTEAVQHIRKLLDCPELPAIIITGDTGAEELKDVESSDFHVLHKPVAAFRIRSLMHSLLH